jgi:lysophospholipase L1-like esterase
MRPFFVLALLLATIIASTVRAEFPLRDGDIWVMAGDSITAQHLHSNFFEAFCFARYPKLKFAFRNSGVGGHTIPSTLDRYGYDIDAWKPTVVSVELGMNDQGRFTTEQYIENMTKMVARIREGKARPVMLTASPINNGDTLERIGGNKRLQDYAKALQEFSKREELPFADQFHQLVDIWGKNKPSELLANALPAIRVWADDKQLAGSEHLKQFLAAQEKAGAHPVSLHGDPVHPGAPGQLMMAAALLKELGAEPFVSSVVIDATGKLVEAKGCEVPTINLTDGGIAFDRKDECLPFPIPDQTAGVLALYPTIAELSQYMLKVPGLAAGNYVVKVNGVELGTVSDKDLAGGLNLTTLAAKPAASSGPNAITAQGSAVLNAVAAKENLVGQWRGLSQRAFAKDAAPELKTSLEELTKKVEEADQKIREAAVPKALKFEVRKQG